MSLGIIIIGALGKMGREIAEMLSTDSDCSLRGTIERENHPFINKDYGICFRNVQNNIPLSDSITHIDSSGSVCIDFSSPNGLHHNLPSIAEKKIPYILGTTGLSPEDISFTRPYASHIPILISPNMSIGINILFLLTEIVASQLKNGYDVEIIEAHHRFKKDAPSGTAKRLAEIVADSYGIPYESCVKDGREGISTSDRPHREIGMHAIRGGDIVGDHTVLFAGIGERIELRHQAHNRSTLARGAVAAAKWLFNKPPGLYTMRDMLGFKTP